MFFRKKPCEACQSRDGKIDDLERQLQSALEELRYLKENVDTPPKNNDNSGAVYFDRSLNWRGMKLFEIEQEIENIYQKFGRTKESISAVNELQSIQQGILRRKPSFEEKKTRRNSYNKQIAHNAVRAICDRYSKQFKSIVLTASTDWSLDSVSDTDRKAILKFIEEHANKVAKSSGFNGDPESFGALLSKDKRAWDRLVGSQIPALLKEVKKDEQDEQSRNGHWTALHPVLRDNLSSHKSRLISNLRKSYVVNEYGTVEKDVRDVEIERFLKSVKLLSKANRAGLARVLGYVKSWASREINNTSINTPLPKNGLDFEYWVADRLQEHQWEAQVTQGSGDQGVDVVARAENLSVAVQCKLYTGSVGNKAVQETVAGMLFFDLDRGVIISTGKYTKSAHALADKNKILLLTPEDIPYLGSIRNSVYEA